VVETTVGYCGGVQANPTYYSMGDHTESIEIVYDPTVVSYESLLDLFFEGHNPTVKRKCQYRSAIWYHDEAQRLAAEKRLSAYGGRAATALEPMSATQFYRAEEYHQKYIAKANNGYVEAGHACTALPDWAHVC
jgi:peptide-methionine (S)-S-oxide reductase